MQRWCAGSWAAGWPCQLQAQLSLGRAPATSGCKVLSAQGQKLPSPSAGPGPKESTSATMEKMLVWCAQVAVDHLPMSLWVPTLQELSGLLFLSSLCHCSSHM